jgi:hypothetical protein
MKRSIINMIKIKLKIIKRMNFDDIVLGIFIKNKKKYIKKMIFLWKKKCNKEK